MNEFAFKPTPKLLSMMMHTLGSYSVDVLVTGVSDDTRCLNAGDVFLCLPRVVDVDNTVKQALAKGATAIVLVNQACSLDIAVPTAHLPDMTTVGLWLRRWFETDDVAIPCIGITGTDGKTSTAWMLREVLAKHLGSAWSCGTFGLVKSAENICDLGNTTPSLLTLHGLLGMAKHEDVGALIVEVSSHGIAQERIAGLPFTAAIWTTLGHDHLEDHGGLAAYVACKAGFVAQVAAAGGVVVANADYEVIQQALCEVTGAVYWYANNQHADMLWALAESDLILTDKTCEITLQSAPAADFHAENLAAIAQVCKVVFDVPLNQFLSFDGLISTPLGRLESVNDQHQVYIDYAHTAEGLLRCLQSARGFTSGRLLLVFGCGGDRDKAKRPAMGKAALLADECWLTADNPRSEKQTDIADDVLQGMHGAEQKVHVCADRKLAIEQAVNTLQANDVLVIAGKGHEAYMEIQGKRLPWNDKDMVKQALAANEVKQCA